MTTRDGDRTRVVDVVVKIGGGVLAHADHLDAALAAIGRAGLRRRLLIVPGGGPFADAVRQVDRRIGLSNDAAHWMAVLAMDQYAHLIVSRLAGGVLVADPAELSRSTAETAERAERVDAAGSADSAVIKTIPVLAPYRWLREADPLPHSWDVTSDSIAAWVARQVGACELVLVKPPGATRGERVDAYFGHVLPAEVRVTIVPADQIHVLQTALQGGSA